MTKELLDEYIQYLIEYKNNIIINEQNDGISNERDKQMKRSNVKVLRLVNPEFSPYDAHGYLKNPEE